MKSPRSFSLGHDVVSVGLLALLLIFTSVVLVSQSIRSKVLRFENVYVMKAFNSMSLVNGKTVNNSYDENVVQDIRKLTLSNTTLGPSRMLDHTGGANGPSEIVGSLVATSPSLDYDIAEPVSLLSNEPVSTDCDLYHGKWVYDSSGPLYSNNSCPVLTQSHNCQRNGRPDKEYENWRWKPAHCDVPRFNARKFLELMRGKTIAFIGDSLARNQMESLLCILWQVEVPNNRGYKRMHRYIFRSTSTTIIRIWSSRLVHKTSAPFDHVLQGLDKIHLGVPDKNFIDLIPNFDVIVISSGHWFTKRSAYILNNEIVGGQLWWPYKSRINKINNIEAYGISVKTILTSLATHPNYTGLTILRSYSPDHYESGDWDTGGSCTGKVKPAVKVVEKGFTNKMYEKQVTGFNHAMEKKTNKSKLRLMDITQAFGYRSDGHPGPYTRLDPNKITKRGVDGRPPPQDCLHWCMPGPIDTWNELMFEVIRREFEGPKGLS
ncbi:protein YLS7 [Apium graveolens]|uniref:protein YLS7 n=1 Tax=Apium graveolens TaxID=4045 RepID=UPI003D7925B6